MRFAATQRTKTRWFLSVLLGAALVLTAAAATGAPLHSKAVTAAGTPFVTLDKGGPSVPIDGAFTIRANVAIDAPTSYLESRLQIRHPSGKLLFQKTEVRSRLETGTVAIQYSRELADLELKPGVYPMELRVRTQSNGVREWVIKDDLLIYDPKGPSVPVAITVRIEGTPSMNANGLFSVDPASSTTARDQARDLARLVIDDTDARITLAIPPVLLEEWLRASQGYSVAGVEGVTQVEADQPVPKAYAAVLELLRRAVATGRLEIADVPYAEPDIGALQGEKRLGDLDAQLLRGHSAVFAALESSPSAGVATGTNRISRAAATALARTDAEFVLVDPSSVESSETTVPSGVYTISGAEGLSALVADAGLSAALESTSTRTCTTRVFERVVSEQPTTPMAASVTIGPGKGTTVAELAECITDLSAAPWATLKTASGAAEAVPAGSIELTATVPRLAGAPAGFWDESSQARRLAVAFLEAVGPNDPEAQLASDQSLVAQSALWAGPDLNWGSADRGRAIATTSIRSSSAVLDAIKLGASDITLSGTSGEVPLSITNGSEKTLTLAVKTRARGMSVVDGAPATVEIRPNENFATIPVDLGQSLSGNLTVELWADGVMLDTTTVAVRASFLDRLVLIAGLVLVLVGMLLFIRHRVRTAARADTIE